MSQKYLVRFWVDVNIEAINENDCKIIAKKLQHHIGMVPNAYDPIAEEYDTQFERILKINDEYVSN